MIIYPNIHRDDFPLVAGCPRTSSKENTINAFRRFCPGHVEVIAVELFKQVDRACEWHVIYRFAYETEIDPLWKLTLSIKDPLDVTKKKISLTDNGLVKIIYIVISCHC